MGGQGKPRKQPTHSVLGPGKYMASGSGLHPQVCPPCLPPTLLLQAPRTLTDTELAANLPCDFDVYTLPLA